MSQQALMSIAASAIVAVAVAAGNTAANVIHVPKDYPTIQEAIDAAKDGDEIIVAPGTYNEAIDFLGKSIELRSSDGPEKTTIDATGLNASVVTIANGEGIDTMIEGFTITGGTGTPIDEWEVVGGGMLVVAANPTISNCHFKGNTISGEVWARGGGIYADDAALTIIGSVFDDNHVSGWEEAYGGAIYNTNSDATITNCQFIENLAWGELVGRGGAISGGAIVTQSVFQENVASAGHCGYAYGGALHGAGFVLDECVFEGNRARVVDDCAAAFGGAISGSAVATNTVFVGNSAAALTIDPFTGGNVARGGAIYGSGTYSQCYFEGNRSLATGQWTTMTGGAIHGTSTLEVGESEFCQNTPDDITGDWIDHGGNAFLPPADLNCDGVVDGADLLILLSEWGECPDPSDCPADLNGDGEVDGGDLLILLSSWG